MKVLRQELFNFLLSNSITTYRRTEEGDSLERLHNFNSSIMLAKSSKFEYLKAEIVLSNADNVDNIPRSPMLEGNRDKKSEQFMSVPSAGARKLSKFYSVRSMIPENPMDTVGIEEKCKYKFASYVELLEYFKKRMVKKYQGIFNEEDLSLKRHADQIITEEFYKAFVLTAKEKYIYIYIFLD